MTTSTPTTLRDSIRRIQLSNWWPKTLLERAGLVLALIPFVALVGYLATHAANAPYGEGWIYADTVIIPVYDGTFPLSAIFDQYIEDRVFTLRLLMMASTLLTRWDVRTHAIAAVVQMLVVFACVFAIYRREDPKWAWLAAVPFAMLAFAINLSTIWLRQYNDIVFSVVFFVLGAWTVASKPPSWGRLAACTVCAVCASFSSFAGLLSWPALTVCLWATGYRTPRYYWLWAIAFNIAIVAYFIGFKFSQLSHFGHTFISVIQFEFAVLGSAFTRNPALAQWVGALGVILAVVALWLLRRIPDFGRRTGAWLALIVFSVGGALSIAYGRAHYTVTYAVGQPHYSLMATTMWIGVAALGFMAYQERRESMGRTGRILAGVLAGGLAILCVAANVQAAQRFTLTGISHSRDELPYSATFEDEVCLRQLVITDDTGCMHDGYWFGPERVATTYELAERRLATFNRQANLAAQLPGNYRTGDKVVIKASLAVQHVPLIDAAGSPIPQAAVFHIMNSGQRDLFLMDWAETQSPNWSVDAFPAFIEDANRVWLLSTRQPVDGELAILTALSGEFGKVDARLDQPAQDKALYPFITIYEQKP